MINVKSCGTLTEYSSPPETLILAKHELLKQCSRPKPAHGMQDKCRDHKKWCQAKARNLCLQYGIYQAKYLGLCGSYPDDIAIQMYPAIRSMQCIEQDSVLFAELSGFIKNWNKLCGFNISCIPGDILKIKSSARVNDLDFMCILTQDICNQTLQFIKQIDLCGPICIMLWTSYGRGAAGKATKQNQTQLLDSFIKDVRVDNKVLDGFRSYYVDNHVPIMHQTLILERM